MLCSQGCLNHNFGFVGSKETKIMIFYKLLCRSFIKSALNVNISYIFHENSQSTVIIGYIVENKIQ